jgi:hypothetical protein
MMFPTDPKPFAFIFSAAKNLIKLGANYANGQQSNLAAVLNPTHGDFKKLDPQFSLPRREGVRGRGKSVSPSPNLSHQGRGKSSKVSIPSILVIKGGV